MLQVIVKTIDGRVLTLENPATGETITWPIDEITEPIEIGSTITLHLRSDSNPDTNKKQPNSQMPREEQMIEKRKMLEQLVN